MSAAERASKVSSAKQVNEQFLVSLNHSALVPCHFRTTMTLGDAKDRKNDKKKERSLRKYLSGLFFRF